MNIPYSRFAILDFISRRHFGAQCTGFAMLAFLLSSCWLFSQTPGTGSIVGVVTDPQQKVVAGAQIEIRNKRTAAVIHVAAGAEGLYSSGPIQPGSYGVRVQAKGFNTADFAAEVHVGNATNCDVIMRVETAKPGEQLPEATTVNIQQPTVQGSLPGGQAENLPINGRNFFDLAQLEPGVQTQDAGVLDAGKNGITSVSLLGQFGRGTRVAVDGVDINDETVGAPTQNIPASAIQEFQTAQSLLDLSSGVTSAGAVNVITRSGGDRLHGELFGVFRDDKGAASLPGTPTPSFSRELFGGNAGGAIIKDKVFVFADAERSKQDLTGAEPFISPFNALNAALSQPYREFNTDERVDWNMRGSTRAFYRFNFFQDKDLHPFGSASSTQQLRSTNNTLTNALGVDFNTGEYGHSLRFEYLKLRSGVGDATSALSGVENPIPGLGINIGAPIDGNCVLSNGGGYCGGPSWVGTQQNLQSDKIARYDGRRVLNSHIFRYGVTFNRIEGARLASYSASPQVGTTAATTSGDPTSYAADWVSLGNGIGFATSKSAFGLPAGGLNADNRLEMYVGDSWKYSPHLTLTYGVHYVHDSGRTDSNLGKLPALNAWGAGYGNQVRNPNLNFAPQVGFAWDAGGNGKTVIRGGAGLFFANTLWNYLNADSAARLTKGIFHNTPEVCSSGVAAPFPWPTSLAGVSSIAGGAATVVNTSTGLQADPTFCGGVISAVAPQVLALSSAYQAAAATVTGPQPNPGFIGTAQTALNSSGNDLFYPGYRSPRSWQMNLGFQKEIRPGAILSIDYIRNVGEHFLIGQDINHSGAARSFNQANAVAARDLAQTNAVAFGAANNCPAGFGQATCMIAAFGGGAVGVAGAQKAYSESGLDSNSTTTNGGPCSYCAFPGTNPVTGNQGTVGGVDMLFPDGRSVYSGVQLRLVQRIDKPMHGVKAANFQVAYSYSKFTSQAQDQDNINLATDNDAPTRFTGPNGMDRKHQVSFGGTFDLPFHTKLAANGHFYSPLPQTLQLPEVTNGGEIFATDWLGAGLGAAGAPEPLPGTKIGQFERGTDISSLQSVINNYNHTYAANFTPAGACLVSNNVPATNAFKCPGQITGAAVMTPADLVSLGWVLPTLGSVVPHAAEVPWLKSMDLRLSWPFEIKDRVTIEPSASVLNVFNFWNAFLPGNTPSSSLLPADPACATNGPGCGATPLANNVLGGVATGQNLVPFRTSFQSGTYALGAPRQFEFGLRVTF